MITFEREPDSYKHWKVEIKNNKATLFLDVSEKDGIKPGYDLKLNSYDLGVDIELNDIVQRIRFEHPEVKVVVITSSQEKNFSAGANIYMLGQSEHTWKVNFCKFTNETRNGFEDSSESGSIKFIAAVNGICAGGGYEVALACDEILLIDDRSSTVSLPEVPLLGVLPGTGGVTRLIDKRKVRKDLADIFCTNADGVRGKKAVDWKLVDFIAPPSKFNDLIEDRVSEMTKKVKLRDGKEGIKLNKLNRSITNEGINYDFLKAKINREDRIANIHIMGPNSNDVLNLDEILKKGSDWWPLKFARELEDLILLLRTNELEVGVLTITSEGSADDILGVTSLLEDNKDVWFMNEIIGLLRRTLSRLDLSSRSIFTIIDNDSCFSGLLAELLFVADRTYMLNNSMSPDGLKGPFITLSNINFSSLEMVNGLSRLATRFNNDESKLSTLRNIVGESLNAERAFEEELITVIPDDLDWNDEIRLSVEERTSFSPDALTGLEANLRFPGKETCETKIFGRLTAWQNWIFNRPNAVSEEGALKLFGTGSRAKFDNKRV
ncbi:MAG: benzoyl-CoA-dihydrodiol lyase [Pelagibacterales bacterium]|nr:benzoyl-CoA-dihydrodiol lyase [Pelagibacterales bacterium]PPR16232.1 MAG: Benzoyl-CoA-dihydrodiol lyase [Alphaproteobacteria bacterium MarineAlpha9_Bin3]|tara:strand:+ start:2655 stop:4304 length:1650 start_codon:yes stop_codon:yes gene_type:complete